MSGSGPQRGPRFEFLNDTERRAQPRADALWTWRLVAGNARPIGRGHGVWPTEDECRAAARTVRDGRAELDYAIVRAGATGGWTWRGTLDGHPVVSCAHPFARRVECRRGLDQFEAVLDRTSPAEGVVRRLGPNVLTGMTTLADGPERDAAGDLATTVSRTGR